MDLHFSQEAEAWRKEVRDFLDADLPPEKEFETEFDEDDGRWNFALAFSKKVGAKKWTCLSWPKQYGGLERPFVYETIFRDEFAYRSAPLVNSTGLGLAAGTLLNFGSEKQKREHLPAIASMKTLWAEGFSEPNAGSDLASLQTRAELQASGDWLVNGQKTYITWAHRCDVLYLAARTDPNVPKHKGISIFCMPLRAKGVTMQALMNIGGGRQNHIFIENVRLPADAIIGEPNQGWRYITNALWGGAPSGTEWARYKRAFDDLVTFCRHTGLSKDPIVRDKLVDLAMGFEVLKLLEYEEIWRLEQQLEPAFAGSIGVLFMKEFNTRFANITSEILGASGLFLEGKGAVLKGRLAELYVRSYGNHAGGTPQTKRMVLATRGLGLPR
ncbi:MAG: hypothetical protein FJ039_04805 [Chloroflexi bacterium]|nr:hypothetical protein [Chloroflexota bacterium]